MGSRGALIFGSILGFDTILTGIALGITAMCMGGTTSETSKLSSVQEEMRTIEDVSDDLNFYDWLFWWN